MPNSVDILKIENEVQNRIITLRGQNVLLDSDVAALYGVETRIVNQAVKNNPSKFPQGYIFSLETEELENLRSKFLITNNSMSRVLPKALQKKVYICWLPY